MVNGCVINSRVANKTFFRCNSIVSNCSYKCSYSPIYSQLGATICSMLKIQLISVDFTVLPLSTLSSCLFLPAYLSFLLAFLHGFADLLGALCSGQSFAWHFNDNPVLKFLLYHEHDEDQERGGQAVGGGAWHTGDSRTNNNKEQRSARIAALISIKYTECIKTKMSSRTNFANAFFDKVLARTLPPFPTDPLSPLPPAPCSMVRATLDSYLLYFNDFT